MPVPAQMPPPNRTPPVSVPRKAPARIGPDGFPGQAGGFPGAAPAYPPYYPGMPWPSGPVYRDASSLTKTLRTLVPIYLAAGILGLALNWWHIQALGDVTLGAHDLPFTGWEIPLLFSSLANTGLFIALAIVFGFWMARVHTNAAVLTGPLPDSTGWAVGAWYIPLVGGFLALGPLRRLWARGPGGPAGLPTAWAVLFALYQIISVFTAVVVAFMVFASILEYSGPAGPDAFENFFMEKMLIPSLVPYAIFLVAGACMFLAVTAIQSSQSAAATRMARAPTWPAAAAEQRVR